MNEFLKYQEVQIALGVIILLIILFFLICWLCGRSMRREVYLCIEDFMRNCHEQDFYAPCRKMNEHVPLYKKLNGRRKAWYYSKYNRDFLEHFLAWFDVADDFTQRMANHMYEYHYFAHSEYLSCIEGVDLQKDLFPLIDDDFLYYVHAKIPSSLRTVQLYKYEVSRGFSDIPQTHNMKFVKEELERQKTYFDTLLKFPLSQQQRESIVKMEDNCLVVSSAGSGKTATSIAKIKYLVEKRALEPSRILAITYTRKAAGELCKRLETLKIKGVECKTFHRKAFDIIQEVTGKTPDLCEMNLMLQCFYD